MSTAFPNSRSLRRLRTTGVLMLALAGLTCRDADPLAPGLPNQVSLAIAPQLQRAAASGGPGFGFLQKVVGTLTPVGTGKSYTVEAPFVRDTAILTFDVIFSSLTQRYTLTLAASDTAGDTLFKSTRELVAHPGINDPVSDVLQYVAPDTAVRFVSVALSDSALFGGDSLTLTAVGYDSFQRRITPLYIGWTSRDTLLATISSRGPATAAILGGAIERDVWIVGRAFNGVADSVLVPVRLRIGAVVLGADSVRLAIGELATVSAEVRSASGVALNRPVVWTSLDTTTVTVLGLVSETGLASGQLLPVRPGATRIVATSGGKSDTTVVVVVPAPVASVVVRPDTLAILLDKRARLAVELRDARNNVLTDRAVTWRSSDTLIAAVAGDGTVTGLGVGLATMSATSEGIVGYATVRVDGTPAAIVRTVVSPSVVRLLALGESAQLAARSYAADSSLVAGVHTWSTNGQSGVASVDSLGAVTALGVGTVYVLATESGGTVDSAVVTVTQIARTLKLPAPAGLDAIGSETTLHATAFDARGSVIPNAALTWTVKDAAVAAIVLAAGDSLVVRSVGNGTTTIEVSSDSARAATQLSVSQVVRSVTVSPSALTLGIGGRERLHASAFDANKNPVSITPADVKWIVEGLPSVIDVDSTGVVHANLLGISGVHATVQGVRSATVNVDVTDAAPRKISFSVDTITVGSAAGNLTVYLSASSLVPVIVRLSDSLGLVRFSSDTLIFDPGKTDRDISLSGVADGRTTAVAADAAALYASGSTLVTVAMKLAPRIAAGVASATIPGVSVTQVTRRALPVSRSLVVLMKPCDHHRRDRLWRDRKDGCTLAQ